MSNIDSLEIVREDDFIEYFLYPDLSDFDIESLLGEINVAVEKYTKEYIWHKDVFELKVNKGNTDNLLEMTLKGTAKPLKTDSNIPFLHGITHYGDNIQDEWFIVAIIMDLTRCFKGLVGRVFDGDGEFLLIESADHLPKWVDAKCKEKVYLYNGQIYISDCNNTKPEPIETILDKLRKGKEAYCLSDSALECIQRRISLFPGNIRDNQHIATTFVPVSIANILKHHPHFVSYAILAFCSRDPIDEKLLRAMRYFPPEERVFVNVRFTKFSYAMLLNSSFIPDRRTGWNLPTTQNSEYKAHLLGMKLACGFEILASQTENKVDLRNDVNWKNFVKKLKDTNYFKGLLENSKDHASLLNQAQNFYKVSCDATKSSTDVTQEIKKLIRGFDSDAVDFETSISSLPKEDNDDWLTLSSTDLDKLLKKREPIESENKKDLSNILSDFFEHKNDYDGIDIDSLGSSSKEACAKGTNEHLNKNIEFIPDEFQNAMQNLLDIIIPEDKWDSNSDMDGYDTDEDLEKKLKDIDLQTKTSKSNFQTYLNEMDKQLTKTTIGSSFEKQKESMGNSDDFDDIENFQPVDIDVNAVKYMMESYKAQMGEPGPVSTLLDSIGVKFGEIDCEDKKESLKNSTV